jgi:hypothetical protein
MNYNYLDSISFSLYDKLPNKHGYSPLEFRLLNKTKSLDYSPQMILNAYHVLKTSYSDIISKLFKTEALQTAYDSCEIVILNNMEYLDPKNKSALGTYTISGNKKVLAITYNNYNHFIGTIVHEMTHKLMNDLYHNKFDPYPQNYTLTNKFKTAVKNSLVNIEDFVSQEFNLNKIEFNDSTSTYTFGKKLYEQIHGINSFSLFLKTFSFLSSNALKMFSFQPYISPIEMDNTFSSILGIINVYQPNSYTETYEDSEIIARFTQVIAQGYECETSKKILKPLYDYWQEVIDPSINHLNKSLGYDISLEYNI